MGGFQDVAEAVSALEATGGVVDPVSVTHCPELNFFNTAQAAPNFTNTRNLRSSRILPQQLIVTNKFLMRIVSKEVVGYDKTSWTLEWLYACQG